MKPTLLVAALLLISYPVQAGENIPLKVAGNVLLLADWKQTRFIATHPDEFHERNTILGRHPSTRRVNIYFASAIAAVNIADVLLDEKWSNRLWVGVIVTEGVAVRHNAVIGIKFSF